MTKPRPNINIAAQNERVVDAIRKGWTADRIRAKWRLSISEIEGLARVRGLQLQYVNLVLRFWEHHRHRRRYRGMTR